MKSFTKVFKHDGTDFSAFYRAETWLKENGYTIGSMQRHHPIGVHKDAESISKWTAMTREEQSELDGFLSSPSFRSGDVTLTLNKAAEIAVEE